MNEINFKLELVSYENTVCRNYILNFNKKFKGFHKIAYDIDIE